MPKQMVINMTQSYPFGECAEGDDQTMRVLVRRQVRWNGQQQFLMERVQFFRRLNQTCIIRLEQVLQQEEGLQLFYEYVPIRMQTWISNINEKFIESFCRQLVELGEYLAKCYINTTLSLDNVGMDQNYKPKYFLDLDFELDNSRDKNWLRNHYHTQILKMFRPYVNREMTTLKNRNRELSPSRAVAVRNQRDNVSTASSTLRLKEKAAALQKERKNESINVTSSQWQLVPAEKNRKQSILSSVSNVKINRLGRRIDEIKSKLKGIYSPQPMNLKYEERSIEKKPNSIAFNWESAERVFPNALGNKEPQGICQDILRDLHQEETIFQKFQKNLAKQMTKALPLKKNQSLKAKEYEQMKKSDDGYFKDFFQVLEDKQPAITADKQQLAITGPKTQNLEPPLSPVRDYSKLKHTSGQSGRPISTETEKALMLEGPFQQDQQLPHHSQQQSKGGKLLQLQNRVKNAINKSKNLINKFKTDK